MKIFKDENGFSTLTVVVSLLLTLSLIFSGAQVYRVCSASADIQNVADASVQAAENKVAEFMVLVKVTDAVILSLGLGGAVASGIGVVCLCNPASFEVGTNLLDFAKKVFEQRDKFANTAADKLNTLQKSLPFIGSVSAYSVAKSNSKGVMNPKYLAITMMVPQDYPEIKPGNIDSAKNSLGDVESNSSDLKKAAQEAEDAAKKANEAKEAAFRADCGNNPNYCMYERAKTKALMNGANNPLYSSVDSWSFSVALKRAQAYYPQRLKIEQPEGSGVKAQADSALRKVFYKYASKQTSKGYVNEDGEVFSADIPHLPKNTDEMKQTSMYSDPVFPVSGNTIHAYSGCPGCGGVSSYGSLSQLDSGAYQVCDKCQFMSSSLGKVAAASSSIDNGFEYHYGIVEKASKDYQKAMEEAAPANAKVKNIATRLLEKIRDAIKELCNKRIYAKPPGSYGAIAFVVNTNSAPASTGFESSFVSSG